MRHGLLDGDPESDQQRELSGKPGHRVLLGEPKHGNLPSSDSVTFLDESVALLRVCQ